MQYIYGTSEDIAIGRESWCDIHIDGSTETRHEAAAYIVRNSDNKSWRIIRDADSFGIKVNGEPMHLVHYLADGDRLEFEGSNKIFRFTESKDEAEKRTMAGRKLVSIVSAAAAILILITAILAVLVIYPDPEDDIRRGEVRKFENSVLKISVRAVIYQEVNLRTGKTDTLDILKPSNEIPSGSGFVTVDGLFITARHCVEPWITYANPEARYEEGDILTRWAADAETFNIMEGRDSVSRRLVSICELSRNGELLHTISGDTCLFHTENDLVRNLRGTDDPLYWRELGHIRSRSSLGDIVSLPTGLKGRISLADADMIAALQADHPAVHVGYLHGHESPNIERSRLFIRLQTGRCLEFKDTDVDKGMSGGPVLIRHKGKLYAAGVLSRILDQTKRVCICVPVTESENTVNRWQE